MYINKIKDFNLNIKIINLILLILFLSIFSDIYVAAAKAEEYTSVNIIAEKTPIKPNSEVIIATEINLDDGWHVYWENPGDSGLPVTIDWKAPKDFKFSQIYWPVPKKITYDILANYGYYNKVILLQTLKTPATLPDKIEADISMLICKEICIPANHSVSLNIKGDISQDNSGYIKNAQNKLPKDLKGVFKYFEQDNMLNIILAPDDISLLEGEKIEFFPLDWGSVKNTAIANIEKDGNKIIISQERGEQDLSEISNLRGLIVIDETKGYSITAEPVSTSTKSITSNITNIANVKENNITWIGAIIFALIGGLILNLMPCVFPVLSMKALSLVKMGEKENKHARMHGIAYTLGVVLSFIAVGFSLILLKEAGSVIGWGFQLQNPIVVATLAYLLFIIGLNLIGFFELSLGNSSNIGGKLTQGKSLSSSFFTGALATIVATPCTAPFMGIAMGFALTQAPIVNITIFAALGFGLALPYLLLSFIPYLRKILPKPGEWMNSFRQFLAFPMFASAIWLIWVLDQQSGPYGVLLILLGMLAIAFALWLSHLKSKNIFKTILLLIFLLLPIISLGYIKTTKIETHNISDFGEEFSQEKLSKLLKGDNPIFVEMTAAWCITCKANHAASINISSTKKLFKDEDIHYLIGDWTNHDDEITKYLNSFDRNGVPLYVFYGRRDKETNKRPEAILLPQILTPSILKSVVTSSS